MAAKEGAKEYLSMPDPEGTSRLEIIAAKLDDDDSEREAKLREALAKAQVVNLMGLA